MTIRKATSHDLNAMATSHIESFPELFASNMGAKYLCGFYQCYLKAGIALVAIDDEQVVGHIVGGTTAIREDFMRNSMRRYWALLLWRLLTNRVVFLSVLARVHSRLRRSQAAPARSADHNPTQMPNSKSAWLQVICLRRKAHGSGLARELLNGFSNEMKKAGYATIRLSVAKANTRAIAFYHKNGFEQIDEENEHLVLEARI